MPPSRPTRSHARWLLLLPAAGLVLFAARTLEQRRAAEAAMSAELLAPLGEDVTIPAERTTAGEVALPARQASAPPEPGPPPVAPGSTGDSLEAVIGTTRNDPVRPGSMGVVHVDEPVAAPAVAPEPARPAPPPLDPALFADWTTYPEAVVRSRMSGMPVLLAFTAAGCETCESLRASVFEEEASSVTMRSAVIPVPVHEEFADGGAEARMVGDLKRRFRVTTYPTLVVWSPATGRTRTLQGYRGPGSTLRFIVESAAAVH